MKAMTLLSILTSKIDQIVKRIGIKQGYNIEHFIINSRAYFARAVFFSPRYHEVYIVGYAYPINGKA